MVDATDRTGANWQIPPGVQLKNDSVNVRDVNPKLQAFLIQAGLVHLHLFDLPLTVTSGKDAIHVQSSKHYKGDAVDLRGSDLLSDEGPAWLLCLGIMAAKFGLAIFDESHVPGAQHIHIEIAG